MNGGSGTASATDLLAAYWSAPQVPPGVLRCPARPWWYKAGNRWVRQHDLLTVNGLPEVARVWRGRDLLGEVAGQDRALEDILHEVEQRWPWGPPPVLAGQVWQLGERTLIYASCDVQMASAVLAAGQVVLLWGPWAPWAPAEVSCPPTKEE